jgi:hypothetical protein
MKWCEREPTVEHFAIDFLQIYALWVTRYLKIKKLIINSILKLILFHIRLYPCILDLEMYVIYNPTMPMLNKVLPTATSIFDI